jgi:hypothetical protein
MGYYYIEARVEPTLLRIKMPSFHPNIKDEN